MITALFFLLAVGVLAAAALALAGRWRPQGWADDPGQDPDQRRFPVVLRGYRMDLVDAEIARLRAAAESPGDSGSPTGSAGERPAGP